MANGNADKSVLMVGGKDRLEILKGMPCPSLVLLDTMMPITRERSFLDAALADQKLRTIPVLVAKHFRHIRH